MPILGSLSIARKLMLLSASAVVALALVGWVGYRSIDELGDAIEAAGVHVDAMRELMLADMQHDAVRAGVLHGLLVSLGNDAAARTEAVIEVQTAEESLKASLERVARLPLGPETLSLIRKIGIELEDFLVKAHGIMDLTESRRTPEAIAALPGFEAAFKVLADDLREADELVGRENEVRRQTTLRAVTLGTRVTVTAALVGTAFSLLLGFVIARSITIPLGKMTVAATQIAKGDLTAEVHSRAKDESGLLAVAFNDMIQYLRGLAGTADRISGGDLTVEITPRSEKDVLATSFKAMVARLRDTNGKIQDGTDVLASSISQIAAATAELAASVAETSAAVIETASAVEEVKEIAQAAGKKAREVSDEANQTANVSRAGEQAVEDAIAGMRRVAEQMTLIADSVTKLGEQTGTIGDITHSVNELAEQSNLLAINAAIEAAKAGEQGRGFGVVAGEVRTLANQSKAATSQIRAILSDIQRASTAAMQATEQGSRSVDAGTKQAMDAGETIRALAAGIIASADAVTQISVSSQQQAIGMEQVGTAIENIRSASDQNARGMRQIESTAHDLKKLSQTLKDLVAQFRL